MPMKKTYSVIYSVDEFQNSNENLYEVPSIDKNFENYKDVFKLLNTYRAEPKEDVINRILDFAKSYKD